MCRWLAYSGAPIALEELIFKTEHSLINQSLSARRSRTPTNGDGFGVGWYGKHPQPGLYRDIRPAWNDENFRDLAAHIVSPMFMAHVRAATGSSVQRANCHPFRYGRWLFVHNGIIEGFRTIKRDLSMAVAPELYPEIRGTTDSELLFYLALTHGLEKDPLPALERAVGLVEEVAGAHGIENAVQMTVGLTDGEQLVAVRYSTAGRSSTLFHSVSVEALHELMPDNKQVMHLSADARAIVSEPLTDLTSIWVEIRESSAVVIRGGVGEACPFSPRFSAQGPPATG